jgi:hypothetical protein
MSRVKLLTSDSAQNNGAIDPKVRVTAADIKGKGLLLEEGESKPRQPITSQMLINKFQHRQEKAKEREEWAWHNEGHQRCSFFKYCWEEGIKLPMAENGPECNEAYNNGNSSKRVCFDDRRPAAKDHCGFDNQLVSVHDRLGGKASVNDQLGRKASVRDRLGGRVNEESNNQLEEMADSMVPGEDIMCRAPERRRTLQLYGEGSSQIRKKPNPQWCLDDLTKSRKIRVQRLRQLEQHEEAERLVLDKKKVQSKVWSAKPKADGEEDYKPRADINMVVFLPKEFMAPVDLDVSDEELGMAQLTLEPKQAIFEKPDDGKRQHLKDLFLKGYVNGKPVIRMLVDEGAAVNLMSYTMLRKIGKFDEYLTQNDMMLVDFEGNVSPAQGAICMELTIGSKTLPTAFFVIKGRGSYNLLLGWDRIQANCCVPSTMHQCIIQWIGDLVEVVQGETSLTVAATEAQGWTYDRVSCISRKEWDTKYFKLSDFSLKPVQAVGSDDKI